MSLPVRFRLRALYEDVARQHALLDRLLPRPLREESAVAYLLYRMLDTLEDGPFPADVAVKALEAAALEFPGGIAETRELALETPGLLPSHRALFENWDLIREHFDRLPVFARAATTETGKFMASGMARWRQESGRASAERRPSFLPDLEALDDYCQAVAGCVGEFHTRLFQAADAFRAETNAEDSLECGAALGRYLQVVNVIRDEAEERAVRSRTFFPTSLLELEPAERLAAIIAHARQNEPAIQAYRQSLKPGPVRTYVTTLCRVAQEHYRHYEQHPEVMKSPTKPPAATLWRILPLRLSIRLLAHKAGF